MDTITTKPLTLKEACDYLGYKKSYFYKLTSSRTVPFSKPNGGKMFFEKHKLDEWMLGNKSTSLQERNIQAATYVTTNNVSK